MLKTRSAIGRLTGTGIATLALAVASPLQADETPGGDMKMPARPSPAAQPAEASVTAAPPAFVQLHRSISATQTRPALGLQHWQYFAATEPDDAWYEKIADWQRRERLDAKATPRSEQRIATIAWGADNPEEPLTLAQRYSEQAQQERRELAQRFASWAQATARERYREDLDEEADPWATTAELLAQGGDDCDGLDLLAYGLLREFGFRPDQLYRGIVRRERDRANHMVTLWFEDRSDPWVVDATGAVTSGLKKFSQLRGWRPTRVFNEHAQFSVVEATAGSSD